MAESTVIQDKVDDTMDSSAETDCAHEQCDSDSSDDSIKNIFPNLSLVLFGNSTSVWIQFGHKNILLGEEKTNIENAEIPRIVPVQRNISEHHMSVINIDLEKTENVDHDINQLMKEKKIHAFIFVVRLGQLTDADMMGLDWLQRVFGDKVLQFLMILFAYETEEECTTVIDDAKKNHIREQLLEKCGGRYQTCNKMMNNQSEIRDLMMKIEHLFNENQQQSYTGEMFNTAIKHREKLERKGECQIGGEIKMGRTHLLQKVCLSLVLLGRTGTGKSSTGNTILGKEVFNAMERHASSSQDVATEVGDVCGLLITVHDTPGFSGAESEKELWKYQEVLQECQSGLCAFLLVLQSDRFTQEDQDIVRKIEELLGEKYLKKTWIILTKGDKLEKENKKLREVINENEFLKKLNQKYEGRFHMLNNQNKGQSDQVKSLITDIFQYNLKNLSQNPCQSITIAIRDSSDDTLKYRRIVLLGKSGSGKSSAGNTILGQEVFKSTSDSKSETSECSVGHATVSGRKMYVVDTPGLFDTEMEQEEFMTEIMKSVYLSSPGPHAFLIVFNVTMMITEQEEKIPQIIEMMFGQEVLKYSILLFTHGDLLKGKSMEQAISENSRLQHLVDQCGGRYQVFNNKDQKNRKQVSDLQKKSKRMIKQNGGHYSCNQIFKCVWSFMKEESRNKEVNGWREKERRRRDEERMREEERGRREEERRQREEESGMREEERRRREEEKRRREEESRMREEERRRREEERRQRGEESRMREEERRRREEERRRREEPRRKAHGNILNILIFGAACAGAVVAAPVGAVVAGAAGVGVVAGAVLGAAAGAGAVAGAVLGAAAGAGAVVGAGAGAVLGAAGAVGAVGAAGAAAVVAGAAGVAAIVGAAAGVENGAAGAGAGAGAVLGAAAGAVGAVGAVGAAGAAAVVAGAAGVAAVVWSCCWSCWSCWC